MADEEFTSAILKAIKQAPEWLRQDLISQDPSVRLRAEEILAAKVAAALKPPADAGQASAG